MAQGLDKLDETLVGSSLNTRFKDSTAGRYTGVAIAAIDFINELGGASQAYSDAVERGEGIYNVELQKRISAGVEIYRWVAYYDLPGVGRQYLKGASSGLFIRRLLEIARNVEENRV